jgi:hypothetical protein
MLVQVGRQFLGKDFDLLPETICAHLRHLRFPIHREGASQINGRINRRWAQMGADMQDSSCPPLFI